MIITQPPGAVRPSDILTGHATLGARSERAGELLVTQTTQVAVLSHFFGNNNEQRGTH